MKFLILLPLLLCSCKQIQVLKGNAERTNDKVNRIANVVFEMTKREYEKNPNDVIVALNYNDAEELVKTPLPTQIDLPPVIPAEVVQGGMNLLGATGLGGTGIMAVLSMVLGVAYKKHKNHATSLAGMDKDESQEYAKQKGLA